MVLPNINVNIAGIVPIFNTFSTVFGELAILPIIALKLLYVNRNYILVSIIQFKDSSISYGCRVNTIFGKLFILFINIVLFSTITWYFVILYCILLSLIESSNTIVYSLFFFNN